jgi:hypothetical protein
LFFNTIEEALAGHSRMIAEGADAALLLAINQPAERRTRLAPPGDIAAVPPPLTNPCICNEFLASDAGQGVAVP